MLFERCNIRNRNRCLKQHIQYFNFKSKIELDHTVDSGIYLGYGSVIMRFWSRLVYVPLLFVVAAASEVANAASEVVAAASEVANPTLEAADDHDTGKKTYEGYQLFRVTPESEEHLQVMRFIEKSADSLWTPVPNKFDGDMRPHVDMMVNPMQIKHLRAFLECSSIPFEVMDYFS